MLERSRFLSQSGDHWARTFIGHVTMENLECVFWKAFIVVCNVVKLENPVESLFYYNINLILFKVLTGKGQISDIVRLW